MPTEYRTLVEQGEVDSIYIDDAWCFGAVMVDGQCSPVDEFNHIALPENSLVFLLLLSTFLYMQIQKIHYRNCTRSYVCVKVYIQYVYK